MNPAAKGSGWLLKHVLWHWPVKPAAWLARQAIDRPMRTLAIATPFLVALVVVGVLWLGIVRGAWGEVVYTAWENERAARHNVRVLQQVIGEHTSKKPPKSYAWLDGNQHEEKSAAREAWHRRADELNELLAQEKGLVPSHFSVRAPVQDFPRASKQWELFYQAHHALVRTIYPYPLVVYFLPGLFLGWQSSQRRHRRNWHAAEKKNDRRTLLLGLSGGGKPHYLTRDERMRHLLISGTTGSGKTEALKLLARHDINSGRGLVFLDMKGDRQLAASLYGSCCAAGREDDFLYFTLESGSSHTYNPLASGDMIAKRDRLISACTWSPEPFYRNESKAAASRVLSAMDQRGAITFNDLYLAIDDEAAYELLGTWAHPDDAPKFARDLERWPEFWKNTSGLRANLFEFVQLRDRLCVPHCDIDFREVRKRNRVVYFELNSQMRKEVATSLARLILEDLKHLSGTSAARGQKRRRFSVYIDEARHAVYPGFAGFISQCRSANIGLVIATQSPLDFETSEDPSTVLTVLQNTGTKLFFCQLDPKSAQLCAELCGTRDTTLLTTQLVDVALFGKAASGVHSQREVKEFHYHPDQIKSLRVGDAVLIQGDGRRALIRTPHPPAGSTRRFSPTIPRRWFPGDQERLGHDRPPLDLTTHVHGARVPMGTMESQSSEKDFPGEAA